MEYAVVGGALLGEKVRMVLNFDSFSGYAAVFGTGVALAGVGYVIKGGWGAFIALLMGALFLLYLKDFFPF